HHRNRNRAPARDRLLRSGFDYEHEHEHEHEQKVDCAGLGSFAYSSMVKICIEYTGDLHCDAVHGPSHAKIATDAPTDNKGTGEAFSPTDLVATAPGTCMSTILAMAATEPRL